MIVNGRYEERTEKVAKEIIEKCSPNHPDRVVAIHGDTSDPEQAKAIVDKIQEKFDGLDILVNNAGINLPEASFEEQYTPDNWQKINKVNLMGPMNMVQASLPLLKQSSGGRIVNVASMIAHVGSPTNPLYTMTKSAMAVFTKSLAADLAGNNDNNITVNSISPGVFATEMNVSYIFGDIINLWTNFFLN